MRRSLAALACLLLPIIGAGRVEGQLEPPSTGGAVALEHDLRMLGHYKRVLVIGAHPDDEDTDLLTLLVRGMGVETAYLSLNRGEGGQNLIGQELGTALGLLRTEELLAARRLDGARQYFTRAYDFGYSKTLDETWKHWPRDTILKDVVRIVRRFRPQIIVSIFRGTERDGHGQHQAAGWAAQEAFRVAGDSTRFRELLVEEGLRPWTPQKLYRNARFDTAQTTLVLQSGAIDPATGKSYHQTAMASRSLHRSQDMGQLQEIGPATVRLSLLVGGPGAPDTGVAVDTGAVADTTSAGRGVVADTLFGGIDTTLDAMPWTDLKGTSSRGLFAARVDSARALTGIRDRARLAELLQRTEADLLAPKPDSVSRLVLMTTEQAAQLRYVSDARRIATELLTDAVADDDRVVPGQRLTATLSVWNTGDLSQPIVPSLVSPAEWSVGRDTTASGGGRPSPVPPDSLVEQTFTMRVAPSAAPTTPYFLRRPLKGALYDWSRLPVSVLGEPFEPPVMLAVFDGPVFGARVEREVAFRINDQGLGEVRRPVTVVPRVDVKLEPVSEMWSTKAPGVRRFVVTLTHGARDTTAGVVRLLLPAGWPAVQGRRFRFTRENEQRMFAFDIKPPAGAGPQLVQIRAIAEDARGQRYNTGVFTVDYPHIRPRAYTAPAVASVRLAPVALPKLTRVGYIRGASDRVPEALRSMGVPIALLDASVLRAGDLSRYDAIIVGPRAYETDSTLTAANDRLLDYAREGGLVIVQYQQHQFFRNGFAPYPLTVGGPRLDVDSNGRSTGTPKPGAPRVNHDRVTDENAPVRILATGDPAVTTPNPIDSADWRGWVQERGLYFARTWDKAYRPVLEMHDPGEPPLEGGLLIAPVGRGTYVYTGLSFFRQLPAGVPGAFRLFANLLALGGTRR